MCLLWLSTMNNHSYGSKVPQNPNFGDLNRHFKPNMRKIQTAISSHLCIRLAWNLTGTSWVVSYGGKTIPRWRTAAIFKIDISPYLSEKSSDFRDVIKKWKSCIGQTPSSTLPWSNCLRQASIRLAWYRHMPASSWNCLGLYRHSNYLSMARTV